jgi:hypothetical protein
MSNYLLVLERKETDMTIQELWIITNRGKKGLITTQLRKALQDDTIREKLDWWATKACAVELLTLIHEVQGELSNKPQTPPILWPDLEADGDDIPNEMRG